VDAVLDTFPYSGTNGTLEALNQGVPVIALEGARACERSTLSILMNAGLPELVSATPEAYADLAVRLATDSACLKAVRAKIDVTLPRSVLVDNGAHVRNLERAYRQALDLNVAKSGLSELKRAKLAAAKDVIWVHAVSVGEVALCRTIIPLLRKKFSGSTIVFSTITKTGNDLAKKLFSKDGSICNCKSELEFLCHK
jgi:3-deoxy-D-manno-octulosonic-acid transferase